jgi:hypothetical protein
MKKGFPKKEQINKEKESDQRSIHHEGERETIRQ